MIDKLLSMYLLFYCMIGVGMIGAVGMLVTNRRYKRSLKLSEQIWGLKEKWINLWKSRDTLLHYMNRWVWYPSLICVFILGVAAILQMQGGPGDGLALRYLYAGLMVPVGLLLLRQGLDFSYREELLVNSIADYVEDVHGEMDEKQVEEIPPKAREEIAEHIARSVKESAATTGYFGKALTAEEEEIMREVIKEFMV